jgi:hypothetical protein
MKEIKLSCPFCRQNFVTSRRDKFWCSTTCSNSIRELKERLDNNKSTQKLFKSGYITYDRYLDKYYSVLYSNSETAIKRKEKEIIMKDEEIKKLISYGGSGYEGVREMGLFEVKHGDTIKTFKILTIAKSYFNSINEPKSLWDITKGAELIDCYTF